MVFADIFQQMDISNTNQVDSDDNLNNFQGLAGAQSINFTPVDNLAVPSEDDPNQFCVDMNFTTGTDVNFESACVDSKALA